MRTLVADGNCRLVADWACVAPQLLWMCYIFLLPLTGSIMYKQVNWPFWLSSFSLSILQVIVLHKLEVGMKFSLDVVANWLDQPIVGRVTLCASLA